MSRLHNAIEGLGACVALGLLLGALEGALAPGLGESFGEKLVLFALLDGMAGLALGAVVGLGCLALPRKSRRIWRVWLALGAVVMLLGLFAGSAARGVDRLQDQAWTEFSREQPLPTLRVDPDAPGPPILIVSVDTLRADALEHMPLLSARAEQGRTYTRAHSTSTWTLAAMASVHTGMDATQHGAGRRLDPDVTALRSPLDPEVRTLAQALVDRGYVTAAVVTNPYLSPAYGLHRGFDRSTDLSRRAALSRGLRRSVVLRQVVPPVRDDSQAVTDRALTLGRRVREGRYLMWVHYLEPHTPYGGGRGADCDWPDCFDDWAAVRRGERVMDEPTQARVQELYVRDLAVLDAELDRLLGELDGMGALDRTLVILVADHGEEFWEHGGVEHGHSTVEQVTHVPLIVWGPGIEPGVVDRAVDVRGVYDASLGWADGSGLGPLSAEGPDAITPITGQLFGAPTWACTDGHVRVDSVDGVVSGWDLDQQVAVEPPQHLVDCLPGAVPMGDADPDGGRDRALEALGYVE